MQHIVITGNVVDGLAFHGPFDDSDEATDWAKEISVEWHVVALEPVATHHLWHLNVYEVDRAYGGPEEGGWWFDTGRYQPKMSVTLDSDTVTWEEAWDHARRMQERLDESANVNEVPPVGYSNYRGGRYQVIVDTAPGSDFPEERPTYS